MVTPKPSKGVLAELYLLIEGLRAQPLADGLSPGERLLGRVEPADLAMDCGIDPNQVGRVVDRLCAKALDVSALLDDVMPLFSSG